MANQKYRDDEIAYCELAFRDWHSTASIAKTLGRSRRSVYEAAKNYKIPRHRIDRNCLVKLYLSPEFMEMLKQFAAEIGCEPMAAARTLLCACLRDATLRQWAMSPSAFVEEGPAVNGNGTAHEATP
jgi:hypothetical protein